jgi:hypothetical protein
MYILRFFKILFFNSGSLLTEVNQDTVGVCGGKMVLKITLETPFYFTDVVDLVILYPSYKL